MKKRGIIFLSAILIISIIFIIFLNIILLTDFIDAANEQGFINVNVIDGDYCVLNLKKGWNLFSFCSELQDYDLLDILAPIENKYRYVMRWDIASQEFDIYSVEASEKPFSTFDDNKSYFIYTWEDVQLDVLGDESGPETRNLTAGWATPSYPYRITRIIEAMYSAILPDLRYIMKWNSVQQEFDIYSVEASEQPFHELNKGEGQFIYMNNPRILQY